MNTDQNIQLLIIDPQNDFCDIPEQELPFSAQHESSQSIARPALPVSGADADMKRLASFIERITPQLSMIHVTLDSHNPVDIAHPSWWRNAQNESPSPFTSISADDVRHALWHSADPEQQTASQAYVDALAHNNRYQLLIWPEHCLIGSWGHNVHTAVKIAIDQWARHQLKIVDFVIKGTHPNTEHYSAIKAEVPDPNDATTQLNHRLIASLAHADLIVVAGEALSHCVANTVRDIADNIGEENIHKLLLLTDCTSAVSGFEALGTDFISALTARGMRTAHSQELRLSQ